jgi:hypothetical protein
MGGNKIILTDRYVAKSRVRENISHIDETISGCVRRRTDFIEGRPFKGRNERSDLTH